MLLSIANNIFYIIGHSFGFETNIDNNASKKYKKYHSSKNELSSNYHNLLIYLSVLLVSLEILLIYLCKCTKILILTKSVLNFFSRN